MNIKNIITAEGPAIPDSAASNKTENVVADADSESTSTVVSPPQSPDTMALPLMKIRFTASGAPSTTVRF
jgi:hypothetical protein